uniref:cGMP-dependent protein kinase n=1 Tax=Phaeomonas parva TaxID=124430 RepID=A0A7S1U765_9STRA
MDTDAAHDDIGIRDCEGTLGQVDAKGKRNHRGKRKRELLRRGSQYTNATANYKLMHRNSFMTQQKSTIREDGGSGDSSSMIPLEHRQCLEDAFKLFDFAHHDLVAHIDSIIVHFVKQELVEGDVLVSQGDEAEDVFIIVEGELEVEVSGVYTATLKPGTLLGELSILMGERRTATVLARRDATVYSLTKNKFLQLQAAASSHSLVQRTTWLQQASVMKRVSAFNITKIATMMETAVFQPGERILAEGEATCSLFLIESGTVEVMIHESGVNREDFNNQLVIEIPETDELERRKSAAIITQEKKQDIEEHKEQLHFISTNEFTQETLEKGVVIGQAVIMVGAFNGKQTVGAWEPVKGKPLHARVPATFKARTQVVCGRISTKSIVENVGQLQPLLTGSLQQMQRRYSSANIRYNEAPKVPSSVGLSDLRNLGLLGQGSFGIVSLVQLIKSSEEDEYFACKAISKAKAVEGEQVEHILNEASILKSLDHPFILRLHATFQDADNLYFLTDAMPSIELWSLIYEDASGLVGDNMGLPADACQFFAANICEVFCFIHLNRVAYRDLKPENLMVDNRGYLVLIDFGFAKRVPWITKTETGESVYHARTFTMCGTPEYIAPELILNQGHDHSVDLWAIGCIIFEIIAGHTPFQNVDGTNDYSDIFTGILSLKNGPLNFPASFQSESFAGLRRLISELLVFESHQRIGNRAGHYQDIFEHSAFDGFSFPTLREKAMDAPWLPTTFVPKPMPADAVPAYDGDQALFEDF